MTKHKRESKNATVNGTLTQGTLFEENYLKRTHKTLTTNPEIALTELVANAWDAGASQVDITIPAEVGYPLIIKDNGVGLTFDEFQERWRKLSYNRLLHQGKKVELPKGVPGSRLAFGRNGIGRHGLLCFNDEYTVVTTKNGLRHTIDISSTSQDPIYVKSHREEVVDLEEHGLLLQTIVQEHRPDADRILEVLSSRFVSDPEFSVFVNGKKVEEQDLAGLRCASDNISVTNEIKIKILFIDTTASHRKSIYQGIAFWQAKRLVGEPSWMLGKEPIIDGRTTNAKKFIFIVQSDDLEDYINEDWTGFRDCEEVRLLYAKVKEYVIESLSKYNQEHIDDIKASVYGTLQSRYGEMTALGRYEVDETIEHISKTKPMASKEAIEIAVEAVANVAQARSGEALLKKLSMLKADEVDALNELLSKWSIKDALVVLEEIDRRLSIIEAIRQLSQDKNTDELKTLHPLVTESRWIFGPEFESQEYTSNQQLQTIGKKIYHSDKGRFLNPQKRPDLFVVGDSTYSITGLDDLDGDGVSALRKILIIELKRGGYKITRTERDQAYHYVEDIVQSGLVAPTIEIMAYVVGDDIDKSVTLVGHPTNTSIVRPIFYSQLVDTAGKRLFKLRETLRHRYESQPGIRLASRVIQEDLPINSNV